MNEARDVTIRSSGVAIRSEHFVVKKSEYFVVKKSEHFVAKTSKLFVANKSEHFVAKKSEHFVAKKSEHFVAKTSEHFVAKKSEHFVATKSDQVLCRAKIAEKGGVRGCAPAPGGQNFFVSTLQDAACPSKRELVLFLWSTRSGMTCVVGGWLFFY